MTFPSRYPDRLTIEGTEWGVRKHDFFKFVSIDMLTRIK
jgi:hypothetical protein